MSADSQQPTLTDDGDDDTPDAVELRSDTSVYITMCEALEPGIRISVNASAPRRITVPELVVVRIADTTGNIFARAQTGEEFVIRLKDRYHGLAIKELPAQTQDEDAVNTSGVDHTEGVDQDIQRESKQIYDRICSIEILGGAGIGVDWTSNSEE